MKQTLNFANVLSSTCSMFCFVDQVWVWIYLAAAVLGNPTPPPQGRYKSCPSDRKTHIRNYKSTCSQEIRSIYLIYFKKRIIWFSNFGVLALEPRSQRSCPEMGKQDNSRLNLSFAMKQTRNLDYDCIVTAVDFFLHVCVVTGFYNLCVR